MPDPTTTGAQEAEAPTAEEGAEWQDFLSAALNAAREAGADTSQPPEEATGQGLHFEVPDFGGDFQIVLSEKLLVFSIVIPPHGGMEKASADNPPTSHSFYFPRSLVGDVDPARLFGIIQTNFKKFVRRRMAVEAVLFFKSLLNFTLLELNPGLSNAGSRDGVIRDHVAHSEKMLRQFFKNTQPPPRGRPSPWTALELSTAVQEAVKQMAAEQVPPPFTAAKVVKRMQKLYPGKAPPSGKALLKLVGRHGLEWADLLEPSPSPSPEPPGDNESE